MDLTHITYWGEKVYVLVKGGIKEDFRGALGQIVVIR